MCAGCVARMSQRPIGNRCVHSPELELRSLIMLRKAYLPPRLWSATMRRTAQSHPRPPLRQSRSPVGAILGLSALTGARPYGVGRWRMPHRPMRRRGSPASAQPLHAGAGVQRKDGRLLDCQSARRSEAFDRPGMAGVLLFAARPVALVDIGSAGGGSLAMVVSSRRFGLSASAGRRAGAPGRTRTSSLRIRSPPLYPLSYRGAGSALRGACAVGRCAELVQIDGNSPLGR